MKHTRMIKIMGAGPAGLSAAIHLARNGMSVQIHERHDTVGSRFHNDFQGLENWSSEGDIVDRLRALSIDIGPFCKPIRKGTVLSPRECANISSDTPLFYLVKRGNDPDSLDNSLKDQAERLGVRIVFNGEARAEECDIIASGPKQPNIFAIGQVFETDSDDTIIALLDDAVAPRGYAYLLIAGGKATLAIIYFGRVRDVKQYLEKAVLSFRALHDFGIRKPRTFGGYGGFSPLASAVTDGKLLVGEAAGFQDFLFGFGIRYALLSGHLAARSIIEGSSYDSLWKREFGRQLRSSRRNRKIYELLGPVWYNAFVRHLRGTDDPKKLLFSCYNRSLLCLPFL